MRGVGALPRIVRWTVALALAIFLSGSLGVVLESAGYGPGDCTEECDGSFEENRCAPNCATGPCAKLVNAIEAPELSSTVASWVAMATPAIDLLLPPSGAGPDGVFQPPRT